METPIFNAVLRTPVFSIGIACTDEVLTRIEFLETHPEQAPSSPLASEAVRQLTAWLNNPQQVFDLPLKPTGTAFQRRVWQEIASIPYGQQRNYGEIARRIGNVPRAVGQACGANPYPIVVPCHRVRAANGLGGFNHQGSGWLLDVKRWLLAHEGHPGD